MDIVEQFCFALADDVGRDRFDTWIGRVAFEIAGTVLSVRAANSFELDRLRRMFLPNLRRTLAIVLNQQSDADFDDDSVSIRFDVDPLVGTCEFAHQTVGLPHDIMRPIADVASVQRSLRTGPSTASREDGTWQACTMTAMQESHAAALDDFTASQFTGEPSLSRERSPWGNTRNAVAPSRHGLHAKSSSQRGKKFRTFESLISGKCNQLARASVEMVLSRPGEASPLILHGPHGVGKTHLLEAIWRRARQIDRRGKILFLTAEQYTTLFLDALKSGGLPAFRRKYRQADLLIIDDIHFLAGKHATLTEFAYTVDEIQTNGRQLVLSSDQAPAQLTALGSEIVARLGGGLPCRMEPLDQQTQQSLVQTWAAERRMTVPARVVEMICERCCGDARQISGVLNRLNVTSQALGQPIDVEMASEILYELVPRTISLVALVDIEQAVCRAFGVTREMLRSESRSQVVSRPRMLAMWLARKFTSAGLAEVSEFFGRKSHSTVVSAEKAVTEWIAQGISVRLGNQARDVRDVIRDLESSLRAG